MYVYTGDLSDKQCREQDVTKGDDSQFLMPDDRGAINKPPISPTIKDAYNDTPQSHYHILSVQGVCQHLFLPTNDFPVWICSQVDDVKSDSECSHALCGWCFGKKNWPESTTSNRRRGRRRQE